MPFPRARLDDETLQAALIGYQHELSVIVRKIAEVRARLGGRYDAAFTEGAAEPAPKKRTMSEAAKRRIAAGQKKRWAAIKAQREAAASKKGSAAGKKAKPAAKAAPVKKAASRSARQAKPE
jgi:hypothetical protein